MYTLYLPSVGGYFTSSTISLILSTLLLLAASISIIFKLVPFKASLQTEHSLQGFSPSPVQFMALAKILAVVVLPVPLVPQNKYA